MLKTKQEARRKILELHNELSNRIDKFITEHQRAAGPVQVSHLVDTLIEISNLISQVKVLTDFFEIDASFIDIEDRMVMIRSLVKELIDGAQFSQTS